MRKILLLLWVVLAVWSAQAGAKPYSVLLLYPDSFYSKMTLEFDEAFRTALQEKYRDRIKFEVLILPPENRGDNVGKLVEAQCALVEVNCQLHQPDLLLLLTPELISRVSDLPSELLQQAKVLVMGLTMEDKLDLPSNFYSVRYEFDGKPNIDLACQLQPNLEQMVVIGGVSDFDQRLYKMYYNTVGDAHSGIDVSYWTNFSMAEVEQRVSKLPDTTSVYYLSLFCDRDGSRYTTLEAASLVVAASRVPVYTSVGTLFDSGTIGGFMFCHKKLGLYAADLVTEIWSGREVERDGTMLVRDISTARLNYQAIKKWGVDTHNIPKEAVVINRPASLWQGHRHWVIGSLLAIGLLSAFIVALLDQHRRVLRGKAVLSVSQAEMQRLAKVLTEQDEAEHRHMAQEIHDNIAQRVATMALGLAKFKRGLSLPMTERMERDLADLQTSYAELAQALNGLARRLHPRIVDELGLCRAINALVSEYETNWELSVGFFCDIETEHVVPDVALTLYRVVQQALANVHRHAQTREARIFLRYLDGGIELVIEDEGIGFDTEASSGGGIGLISMRERVLSHGGEWEIYSARDAGTSIRVWVPLQAC